jgi:hypothetical protein
MQISTDDRLSLKKVGCFSIGTWDPWKIKKRSVGEAEACRRFVSPLLRSADHARLYPTSIQSIELALASSILLPKRGYLELNLSKECVKGFEDFWRAGAQKGEYLRGTIVVVQPATTPLSSLLKQCVLYGVPSSRYQIQKGCSTAAIKFASEQARLGKRCFLFSASNGVEHVDVFAPVGILEADLLTAYQVANKPGWRLRTDERA